MYYNNHSNKAYAVDSTTIHNIVNDINKNDHKEYVTYENDLEHSIVVRADIKMSYMICRWNHEIFNIVIEEIIGMLDQQQGLVSEN